MKKQSPHFQNGKEAERMAAWKRNGEAKGTSWKRGWQSVGHSLIGFVGTWQAVRDHYQVACWMCNTRWCNTCWPGFNCKGVAPMEFTLAIFTETSWLVLQGHWHCSCTWSQCPLQKLQNLEKGWNHVSCVLTPSDVCQTGTIPLFSRAVSHRKLEKVLGNSWANRGWQASQPSNESERLESHHHPNLLAWWWGGICHQQGFLDGVFLGECACSKGKPLQPLPYSKLPQKYHSCRYMGCHVVLDQLEPSSTSSGAPPNTWSLGKSLEKGFTLFPWKGKPLAHGLKAVLWSIQGDHEFFSLHLKLPHWASKQPCWECNASKEANPVKLWYKTLEKGKQGFKHISNEEAKEHPRSAHSLFSGQVPGLTTKMVRGDCLHIIFTKGVLGHLLGGIIHYLCYYNGPGVTQVIPPEARLGAFFEALNKEYQKQGSPTRVSNLRLSMITDPKTPHASYATLDLKAAETKHFLHAFILVAEEILEKGEAHEKAMLEAMECMSQLTLIFDQADAFLSEVEWAHAMSLATSFLSRYEYLSAWALEKGRTLFNKVMKFHTFQHLVENSRFLNPEFIGVLPVRILLAKFPHSLSVWTLGWPLQSSVPSLLPNIESCCTFC